MQKEQTGTVKEQSPALYECKIEFIQSVLEAAEKRRDAVENKSSILVASNAILLTAIAALGFPLPASSATSLWLWLRFGLAAVSLASIAASSLCAIRVFAPFTSKQRVHVMNIPLDEYNIFYAGKIAKYSGPKAYLAEIDALTEAIILEQMSNQAYRLSRLVMHRYGWFHWAQQALIVSIIAFILLVLTGLF